MLAYVTRKIGPLVAVGEPGHPPILGTRNLYVDDDNWQEQVIDLAQRSQLVILTVGVSGGVLWEVRTMVKEVAPDRLLLSVPGASRREREKNYVIFLEKAAEYFPAELPERGLGGEGLFSEESLQEVGEKQPGLGGQKTPSAFDLAAFRCVCSNFSQKVGQVD